jgi:hypothetical protein
MTPLRFKQCLVNLGLEVHDLATNLECDVAIVRRWMDAEEAIPLAISAWLATSLKRGRTIRPAFGTKADFRDRPPDSSPVSLLNAALLWC